MVKKSKNSENEIGFFDKIIIADAVFLALGEVIIFLVTQRKMYYGIGFFTGVILAVAASLQMKFLANRLSCISKKKAVITAVSLYMIRIIIGAVIIAVLYITDCGDPLTALLGLFALKISAYGARIFEKSSRISLK